jgi:Na+/melibiose symporter-like transporter
LVSGILGGLAGIVAVVIPSLLLTSSVDLVQYREIMLLFAIGCLILMEIQAYRVKIRFIAEPDQPMGLKDSVKEALRNKSFITLVACNFTMIFMSSVAGSGLNYFTEYALGVSGVGLVIPIIFILLGLISGAIALMRWVKTIGLKPAMIRGLLLSGIGLILIPFMPGWSIYIPLAFVGFGLIIPALSFNVFIGDLADEDELKTSNRREGMFFGVNALITKPAQSIAAAFIVYMLEFYQYVKPIEITPGIFESQVQSPYTIFGIKIMFGLIPGIALLIGAWIFSYYGLTKERSEQVKLELSKRNAEKRTF